MERQQVVLLTTICTLLFSYGSGASTHISPQGSTTHSIFAQSNEDIIDFDPGMVAKVDSAQFNGMAEFNAVTEFARQASGFQYESGGDLAADASSADDELGYLPRVSSRQHDLITLAAKTGGVSWGESSTLLLLTLGFAALVLKRRRLKFLAIANRQASGPGKNGADNHTSVKAYHLDTPQRRHSAIDGRLIGAAASDDDVVETADTPRPANTPARATERNPYAELAQSVQKLEALALEMAHFR